MKTITCEKIIHELEIVFLTHDLPKSIKSVNGPHFIPQVFTDVCTQNGIKHLRVIPKWPQANNEVERQNASMSKRIRIAYDADKDYKVEIPKYVMAFRCTLV